MICFIINFIIIKSFKDYVYFYRFIDINLSVESRFSVQSRPLLLPFSILRRM